MAQRSPPRPAAARALALALAGALTLAIAASADGASTAPTGPAAAAAAAGSRMAAVNGDEAHYGRIPPTPAGGAEAVAATATAVAGVRRTRRRRYALQGTRWRVRDLWWRVSRYPAGLPRSAVDAALRRAFQVWAEASGLRFHQAVAGDGAGGGSRRALIDVRWERGAHGDWAAFDGPGGVLAHALYPSHGGAVHFDADERWAPDAAQADASRVQGLCMLCAGPSVAHVAAHEIGHALGVAHAAADEDAVMSARWRWRGRGNRRERGRTGSNARGGDLRPLRLSPDDVAAARALYGPAPLPARPRPSPPPGSPGPSPDSGSNPSPSPGPS